MFISPCTLLIPPLEDAEVEGSRTQFLVLEIHRRHRGRRPGEMVQTVTCLRYKHKDPSVDCQNLREKLAK